MNKVIKTTKHLIFTVIEEKPKTVCIGICNKDDDDLGYIEWYGPWRQYCYFPDSIGSIVMAKSCLEDISTVIQELMDKRKK